jgi:hypothetical protein
MQLPKFQFLGVKQTSLKKNVLEDVDDGLSALDDHESLQKLCNFRDEGEACENTGSRLSYSLNMNFLRKSARLAELVFVDETNI